MGDIQVQMTERDVTEASEEPDVDNNELLSTNDTKYGKSFRHFTREALPRLDNYRNMLSLHATPRPTLDELHNATLSRKSCPHQENTEDPTLPSKNVKFGWIEGVLIRCLKNIWGVMLFLRLSWVTGQAGVAQSMILILTTSVVTTITTLSMSAICTNGIIKGGGTYYMISRSLGPEFGGSIGLIFSMANAVACALYVVGFGDSLMTLIPDTALMIDRRWDQAIYGCIVTVLLTSIVIVGMKWEAKAQIVLLVVLLFSIANFFVGAAIGPKSDEEKARGFVGFNMTVLQQNMGPDYRYFPDDNVDHNFFSVMAIFFPAATGILAGANISGDLKDPQTSIPKGTLLAIILTTISYLLIALISGWTVLRDASGDVSSVANWTMGLCVNGCSYGLQNSFYVVHMVSGWSPLFYGGCFAATLSSALASLVSAPKVFQALCQDKLYPYIGYFGKGYGPNKEPIRGYLLTFAIAIIFILMGRINKIAPLISNFFLAAYTLINFATFHASLAKPVGWRPTFRFYNMWLSLIGSVLCVAIMFMISWVTALITFGFLLMLYLIVSYRKPDVNWGSTPQAQTYKTALSGVHHLSRVAEHVKNYRPQILVLSGFPGERPLLVDFTYLLTEGHSLMMCGHIIKGTVSNHGREALNTRAQSWLNQRKVKAFYALIDDVTFKDGASALVQASGLGKLKPNILLMGFKENWQTSDRFDIEDYVEVMHKALDVHMAIAMLRVEGGLYTSDLLHDDLHEYLEQVNYKEETLLSCGSMSDVSLGSPRLRHNVTVPEALNTKKHHKTDKKDGHGISDVIRRALGGTKRRTSSSFTSVEQFTRRYSGTVDVWWLYDDGGLTLLLPYILSARHAWSSCPLRVFTLANKNTELEIEERNMAALLSKFRIDYSALKIVPDITKRPRDSTLAYFDKLIAPFKSRNDSDSNGISEADLLASQTRTHRHLRLRESIMCMSGGARLVCVTLPMPRRRSVVPPPLYLAWLHAIATAADRTLLVRGNHAAVLTFYS